MNLHRRNAWESPGARGPLSILLSGARISSCGDTSHRDSLNHAQGFFAMYCTSCHTVGGAGDPTASVGLDFTQYAQVQSHGAVIRCGTAATHDPAWSCGSTPQPSQFPICNTGCTNPKPTQAERTRLAAWITAGMPE